MGNGIFIAKVRIRVSGHVIMPGETVAGLSEKDIKFLLKKRFIKRVPAETESQNDSASDSLVDDMPDEAANVEKASDSKEEEANGGFEEDNDIDPETLEDSVAEFYTEEQLNALGNKGDIIEYAESIGLSGLTEKDMRTVLIDKVLAYIAEVEN